MQYWLNNFPLRPFPSRHLTVSVTLPAGRPAGAVCPARSVAGERAGVAGKGRNC